MAAKLNITKIGAIASAAVGAGRALVATVTITGKPLRARDEPASVKFMGIPIFNRDSNLERTYLGGLIKRGRSAYAKQALAAKGITTSAAGSTSSSASGSKTSTAPEPLTEADLETFESEIKSAEEAFAKIGTAASSGNTADAKPGGAK